MPIETPVCSACLTKLSSDAVGGLCPKCLVERVLHAGAGSDAPQNEEPPSFPSTPFTGTRLRYFGDYELLEEIARGGMGVVFKARQVNLNRLVALKLISSGALASETIIKRFKAEAEAAAALSHPNIVPIYEIGEVQGQHYFSMALIDGPNLHEHLAKNRISPHQSVELIITMVRTVHHAHQHGVLHRDIKPGNILIDKNGTPHLTDFGLAKIAEHEGTLTQTNAILGTPAYMAPEQARGDAKNVTTAADVYALGAVLYECLTGQPPFAGSTSYETLRQVLEQEPRRPSLSNLAIDRDLETVCLKCLEKDRQRRYASADALASDLERWSNHEPIQARPIGNLARLGKWTRRKPAIAALAAVTALALLACLALAFNIPAYREAERARRNELAQRHQAEEALIGVEHARKLEAAARKEEEKQRSITENALAELRKVQYLNTLNIVERDIAAHDFRIAENLLDECPPDFRGWEWNFLKRLCISTNEPLLNGRVVASEKDLYSVAFASPEEHLFSMGQELHVFSPADGQLLFKREVSPRGQGRLAISPDGTRFAFANHGYKGLIGSVYLANESPIGNRITDVVFTPDGAHFVTCGMSDVPRLWKVNSDAAEAVDGKEDSFTSLALSPDGKTLAAAVGRYEFSQHFGDVSPEHPVMIRVFELAGEDQREFYGHRYAVWKMAFAPDSRRLITVSGLYGTEAPGEIKVWDVETGKEIMNLRGHRSCVFALAVSPDGRRIATGGGALALGDEKDPADGIYIWDLADGKLLFTLKGHTGPIHDLAFSASGRYLASASHDSTVRVWDATVPQDEPVDLPARSSVDLWPNNDKWPNEIFTDLPRGLQRFDGIRFDVRGAIRPARKRALSPEIPIGRSCRKIHALVGAGGFVPWIKDGDLIVRCVFYSEDDQQYEWNLREGEHLRVSGHGARTKEPSGAPAVWANRRRDGDWMRLYHIVWTNPLPNVAIRSLDFLSGETSAPLLIAVTVE